jgi:3-hydroxymyristoyl/3-hydroxydecanoyl-(acyl carrier protein) dehydratase
MSDDVAPPAASPFEEVDLAEGRVHAVVRPAHAEMLCEGHFPGDPLVPGAYLAGLMADAAALLLSRSPGGGGFALRQIESCAFARPVRPSARIDIEASLAPGDAADRCIEARVLTGDGCAARAILRFGRRSEAAATGVG